MAVAVDTHSWQWTPNHGSGHPLMAVDTQSWQWTPTHGSGHPIMAVDTQSWQWTPTHGSGHPLMAVDTHSWQWTPTHGSGHPLMAVDTQSWQWTPTHGSGHRLVARKTGKQRKPQTKLICVTLMLKWLTFHPYWTTDLYGNSSSMLRPQQTNDVDDARWRDEIRKMTRTLARKHRPSTISLVTYLELIKCLHSVQVLSSVF